MSTIILGIESSCDDTSAAVIKDGYLLSNVVASQAVHEAYGGVGDGAFRPAPAAEDDEAQDEG